MELRTDSTCNFILEQTLSMGRAPPKEMAEAEELLDQIESWSEEEIEELPKLYREKVREFRRLRNRGEE